MHAQRFNGWIAMMTVWAIGVGYAGNLMGAEGVAKKKDAKAAAADVSRELAMRPLPAYRIAPPDVLQIEVASLGRVQTSDSKSTDINDFCKKNSKSGGVLSNCMEMNDLGKEPSGAGGVLVDHGLNLTVDSDNLSKTGTAKLVLSGPNTYTGSTTISGGTIELSGTSEAPVQTPETTKPGEVHADIYIGAGEVKFEKEENPTPNTFTGSLTVEKTDSENVSRPINGNYLVAPDGTVNLRQFGTVQVMGMTIEEARAAVKKQVSKYLVSPVVNVEVLGYNSKVFYIITQGAGLGDNIRRAPITGSDTVLDALSAVNGLSQVSGKKMWIARPSPTNPAKGKILPIDYVGITQRGATATNYQLMPGDRLFIAEDKTIAVNNWVSKQTAPIERVLGLISLGASTIERVEKVWPKSEDDPPSDEETEP